MKNTRVIHGGDVPSNEREGYSYQRFVKNDQDTPFDFLRVVVYGRHKTRKVLAGIRNYYVVTGEGNFVVNDEIIPVKVRSLVRIMPGENYSYEGSMELIEFNIDTGQGIGHEDVE